jgi:hypothetical protein
MFHTTTGERLIKYIPVEDVTRLDELALASSDSGDADNLFESNFALLMNLGTPAASRQSKL